MDVLWLPDTFWNLLRIVVKDAESQFPIETYALCGQWLLTPDRVEMKSFMSFPVAIKVHWVLDRISEMLELSETMRDVVGSTYQEPSYFSQERRWIKKCYGYLLEANQDAVKGQARWTCRSVILSFLKSEMMAYNTDGAWMKRPIHDGYGDLIS
jgi:hypothetical protein